MWMNRNDTAGPTHAGGVVVRDEGGERRYLLVNPKSNPQEWVFPKGHVDPGERPPQTAVREVAEEAAVRARVVVPLGTDVYQVKKKQVHALFFLMRYIQDVPVTEDRGRRWCTFGEAAKLLSFEGARQLLRRAEELFAFQGGDWPQGSDQGPDGDGVPEANGDR